MIDSTEIEYNQEIKENNAKKQNPNPNHNQYPESYHKPNPIPNYLTQPRSEIFSPIQLSTGHMIT